MAACRGSQAVNGAGFKLRSRTRSWVQVPPSAYHKLQFSPRSHELTPNPSFYMLTHQNLMVCVNLQVSIEICFVTMTWASILSKLGSVKGLKVPQKSYGIECPSICQNVGSFVKLEYSFLFIWRRGRRWNCPYTLQFCGDFTD
jgi:hypothetical protein